MKRLLVLVCLLGFGGSAATAAPQMPVRRATFTSPLAYPADPSYRPTCGPQPFRWGWFGATHYPPAPQMHRDFEDGWREWHYRW